MSRQDPAELFGAVAEHVLAEFPEDDQGRMLQSPGLRTSGKFYAFMTTDALIVKLPETRVNELIAADIGQECSPRPGRPMKQWVQLPVSDFEASAAYVVEARAFVASLIPPDPARTA